MLVVEILAAVTAMTTPANIITFKHADVLVVDAANEPLFRSSRDYLLKAAKNPAGQVVRYDPVGKRVLVSIEGPEYWVRCAELAPMAASCPAILPKPATRSVKIPRAGVPAKGMASRGLPTCPGDPRCPQSD
ncbi:MAG: hypothetical protein V4696_08855 [Pseudomonadota bacterium]